MPYINVNDAYIMDNTGKQVDDAVDYALANSNRNLLDNPWFTVNQRGVTSELVDSIRLFTDRWKSTSGNTVTINSNGLTMASNANTHQNLMQGITNETFAGWAGKTLTVSAMTQSGVITSRTFTCPTSIASGSVVNVGSISIDGASFVIYLGHERDFTTQYGFWLYSSTTGATVRYRAVKLELGSYSTLANDVPPDYKTELDKCQYYYRELKAIAATYLAQGVSVAQTNFRVILPYTMRAKPTVTYSGTLTAYYSGGNAPVTAISVAGTISDAVQLSFTTSGISGANQPVSLDAAAGAKICLSADL